MGQEQDSKMLAMESKNNAYFYDYVSKVPGQPKVSHGLCNYMSTSILASSVCENMKSYFFFFPLNKQRHFRTIFSLAKGATGGAGAVLVSITTQTTSKSDMIFSA